jgi:hypothetical protein
MYFSDLGTSADFLSAPFMRAVGWVDTSRTIEQEVGK